MKRNKQKTLRNKADKKWNEDVKKRDNYTCQICGEKLNGKNCHAHHILPKIIKVTRWDIKNGITLCYQHHKIGRYSPHMNALWFTTWLQSNKEEQYEYLLYILYNRGNFEI